MDSTRQTVSFGLLLAALILVFACLSPLAAAEEGPALTGGPRIQFPDSSFNFGTMYQDEVVDHEFTFENVGNATLTISKVTSSCGCTAALPSQREIPPGGGGRINITFRSGRMRDRVTKHVYVESNDPAQPRAVLTITGVIKVEVETSPRGVFITNVLVGESVERSVVIRPVEVKTFKILNVRTGSKLVEVEKPRLLTDKSGGYELKIRFGPASKPERVNTYVLIQTDLAHSKALRIPVYGKVVEKKESPLPNPSG